MPSRVRAGEVGIQQDAVADENMIRHGTRRLASGEAASTDQWPRARAAADAAGLACPPPSGAAPGEAADVPERP
ncbi:MAG TPA: hypothetical protein VED20_07870 [Streptosporangiaceae bacterium]|nr:hypothetical protein [Streptosporangiaceae bacterium]